MYFGRSLITHVEISINGQKVCTAGIEDFGVLSTKITRVKRNPSQAHPVKLKDSTLEEFLEELAEINVTGLDSNDSAGSMESVYVR
jgi:hypothetical protein